MKYLKDNLNEDPYFLVLDDKRMFDDWKIPIRRTQNERFKKRILDNFSVNFSISELAKENSGSAFPFVLIDS